MRPSLTLPQIHERFKKQSLSQRYEPNTTDNSTSRKRDKKDQQYRLIEDKLQSHRQELERNATAMKQLTDNFDLVRSELISEQQASGQLREATKKYREEIDRLNKQLRSSKVKSDELEKQLAKEQEEKTAAINALKDLESKSNSQESSKISKLQSELSALTKQATKMRESNAELTAQTQSLRKEIANQKTNNAKLLLAEKERSQQLALMNKQVVELQAKLASLENKDSRQSKLVSELEARASKLSEAIRQKEQQLSQRMNEIKILQDGRKQYQLDLHALRRELEEQKKRQAEAESAHSQCATKHDQTQQRFRDSEMANASLRTQLTKSSQDLAASKEELKRYVPSHLKLLELTKHAGKLQQSQKQLQSSVNCTYCNSQLKEPVTIIPCGHCFCLNCKKGYQKECCRCGPKVKIDALYRNELLDEVLEVLKVVGSLSGLLGGIKDV